MRKTRFGIVFKLNQGDLVLVPVPFTDLSSSKKRPVLVLSNDAYNLKSEDFLVAAVTSQVTQRSYAVIIEEKDLVQGILPLTSQVRSDKLYSLSQKLVVKKFGRLKKSIFEKVVGEVNSLLKEKG
ncbi:TPA: type II toxin-antitoxin system PemK/MazF family toxin [Candidatus Micrarchaeota archaeon]|nr:type II toxin-antitoxin system PemK/MazF family toxin [Candidatus Micrarchaeota archaeon]